MEMFFPGKDITKRRLNLQADVIYERPYMFTDKQLRSLILPLLVEQILQQLVGAIDTIMVSGIGEVAISGVTLVNEINQLIIFLLSSLAGGGTVIVAQYLGYGDHKTSDLSAGQLIKISFLLALVLGACSFFGGKSILNILYSNVDEDVMQAAMTYFAVTSLSFPLLGVYNSITALFRSMNETRITMYISIGMNAVNIVGNYIGVYVLKLGVAGVAWPTVISRIIAAIVMFGLSLNRKRQIVIYPRNLLVWKGEIIRKILSVAVPNALESSLFHIGRIIVATFIAAYGTAQLAANGVAHSLFLLVVTASGAMQLAIVTVIGQSVGSGDYEQTKLYFRKMTKIAYVMTFVNGLLVLAILPWMLRIYGLEMETSRMVTEIIISCVVFSIIFHTPAWVLPAGLRATGDAGFTMIVGVTSVFLVRVFGSYLFGTVCGLGVIATWFAMYADWIVRSICFMLRYRSEKWMKYRLI